MKPKWYNRKIEIEIYKNEVQENIPELYFRFVDINYQLIHRCYIVHKIFENYQLKLVHKQ